MAKSFLDLLVTSAFDNFHIRYGRDPRWIVAAPGRVNIIGEHIDYNDGFVLPMAIDRYCVIAAGEKHIDVEHIANDEGADHLSFVMRSVSLSATIFSAATDDEAVIPLDAPARHSTLGHWSNYVAGVLAGCAARGMRPPGFQAVVESAVPVGGGLSSSASLEVATATLVEAMTGVQLEPVEKALLCQQAEHEYAGVPCGIMDQFASVMCHTNHLLLLDCRSRHVEHIPLFDPTITVLIFNTNVKHELSGGEYAERRGRCEVAARKLGVASLRDATLTKLEANRSLLDPVEFRRARHAISEIARTTEATSAIKAGDWPLVGRLMFASHDSLRDDYEVSCHELDLLVEFARGIGSDGGMIGSRMTGGGFGGCTVSLVRTG
ncbi:MAG: galactokinase, partial [Pirellulales bacterium]